LKTVFDKTTREELITRINSLNEDSKAEWGKMNVYQMLKHSTLWDEWVAGKANYKRVFLGRLFGKIALRSVLKDDKPFGKNSPTLPDFTIKENHGDVAVEKSKWITLIEEYEHFSNPNFVHSFFGKMTKEQIGFLAYKHTDHHLRQFNN
jgi:hypothetical protein